MVNVEYFSRKGIRVIKVEMGLNHIILVCDRGKVYGWGDNRMG